MIKQDENNLKQILDLMTKETVVGLSDKFNKLEEITLLDVLAEQQKSYRLLMESLK
jgi:hypothetical protein